MRFHPIEEDMYVIVPFRKLTDDPFLSEQDTHKHHFSSAAGPYEEVLSIELEREEEYLRYLRFKSSRKHQ